MRLSDSEIRAIARDTGLSEPAVRRLLGSVRVELCADGPEESPQVLQLGLMIQEVDAAALLNKPALAQTLTAVIAELRSSCPQVVTWIGRGDFNPTQLPADIPRGKLLHACRTARRLKAKALRSIAVS